MLISQVALPSSSLARPGIGSNRALAEHAGISDEGQISKLLARLERLGLLQNTGKGQAKGAANAWSLTPLGRQVTQQIVPRPLGAHNNRGAHVPSDS